MSNSIWYKAGYKAGCEFLAKNSDMSLLDHYESNNWDLENETQDSEDFSKGFGDAYGFELEEPIYGMLAKKYCHIELELQVLKSGAGWYIGTMHECEPYSRESVEYWATGEEAQIALDSGSWTQRDKP